MASVPLPVQNLVLGDDPLSLDRIRAILTRLEDTIIFSLIERAQFAHNPKAYRRGEFQELKDIGFNGSWLDWFLKETESFHSKARRYTSPEEYPFTDPADLPPPILKPFPHPTILYPNKVNVNASILSFYVQSIVPRITRQATLALSAQKRANGITGDAEFEDDGNYGSAAFVDLEVLQAISKRVHYGKFVSESKFRDDPAAFIPHIHSRDRDALAALITKPEVEKKLLQRLRKKANLYALNFSPEGEPLNDSATRKIDVDGVVELYEHYIIPLTKEVEVDYLLVRLDGLSKEEVDALASQQKKQ
ncbi:chorismate mutase [Trametes versicolor FP-101664 SS1]|uniref:chorismate mutase n=1 Tax=Trametes versicolor (strain FP-101664) TaxID=717944 RepID=UPI0004621C7C|nr:chorismate mutase [Trametes versicolor FP-101664 SS1]EIW59458.1 chorismate mutase [Trametes versicolor FP-101664 SS1]